MTSIWSEGSATRPEESMASPTLIPDRPPTLAEFGADVLRRREAAGVTEVARNAGNRRTESKKALLRAIEELGGKW